MEEQVYMASEIQTALRIGRSKTYQYLEEVYKNKGPFRVVKVGKQFRVPQKSFDQWINGSQ